MSEILPPCQFCGQNIIYFNSPVHTYGKYRVCCKYCGATTGSYDSPQEAMSVWSQRDGIEENKDGYTIKLLRKRLNLTKEDVSDKELLEQTKGTFSRATVDVRVAINKFLLEIIKVLKGKTL